MRPQPRGFAPTHQQALPHKHLRVRVRATGNLGAITGATDDLGKPARQRVPLDDLTSRRVLAHRPGAACGDPYSVVCTTGAVLTSSSTRSRSSVTLNTIQINSPAARPAMIMRDKAPRASSTLRIQYTC